jgi:hypothetical protein
MGLGWKFWTNFWVALLQVGAAQIVPLPWLPYLTAGAGFLVCGKIALAKRCPSDQNERE